MSTILLIVLLVLLFGGGGFYGYRRYGAPEIGANPLVLILVLLVLFAVLGVFVGPHLGYYRW